MTSTALSLRDIPLEHVVESTQNPRKYFDKTKLDELAQSIREKGVIEPILVRPIGGIRGAGGQYEVVAGARRFRASKLAGLSAIPAIARELTDVEAIELAVTENEQRQDVNAMEQAEGYSMLLRIGKGYTPASIAKRVGRPESFVVRRVKLLGLEAPLQDALREGRLSIGHAEGLLRLTPAQRKEASHPENGVIWQRSPLFEYGQKWTPTADDLRPLSVLEEFIRRKSHFDPSSRDARHLTPGFGNQLDLVVTQETQERIDGAEVEDVDDVDAVRDGADEDVSANLVELSLDPMVRSRLRAGKAEQVPLGPSKWREVKPGKECRKTKRGVITHGAVGKSIAQHGRILNICTSRSCATHWPAPAKKKRTAARASSPGTTSTKTPAAIEKERIEREKEAAAEARWERLLPRLNAAFVKHLAGIKFSAALFKFVAENGDLWRGVDSQIYRGWGVKLTDKTAAQVFALASVNHETQDLQDFKEQVKFFRFDCAPIVKAFEAEQKKAAKPAAGTSGSGQKAGNVTKKAKART